MKRTLSMICIALMAATMVIGCGAQSGKSESSQTAFTTAVQTIENANVSYLGPEGTYTEEAAQLFFPDAAGFIPEGTVPEAIADVTEGRADFAVIPQENTIGGAVTNYVDALIAEEHVFVVGEVILPINQTLMGFPGASLEDIKLVCSHAQGITEDALAEVEKIPEVRCLGTFEVQEKKN